MVGNISAEDGIDETLTFSMKLDTWKWVGNYFIYVNNTERMSYSVGGPNPRIP